MADENVKNVVRSEILGKTIGELESIASNKIKSTDLLPIETDISTNAISMEQIRVYIENSLLRKTSNQLGSFIYHPCPAGTQNIPIETNGFGDVILPCFGQILAGNSYPDLVNFLKARVGKDGFNGENKYCFKYDSFRNEIILPDFRDGLAVYGSDKFALQNPIFPKHTITSGTINVTTQEHSHSYTDDGIFGPNGGGYSGGDITGLTRNKTTDKSTVIINPFTVSSSNISNLPNGIEAGDDYKIAGIQMIICVYVKPSNQIAVGGDGGSSNIGTEDLNMNNYRIINQGEPLEDADGVRLIDLKLDSNKIQYKNDAGNYEPLQDTIDSLIDSVTGDLVITKDLDMKNFKIINLATPTLETDATTKKYVDDEVKKSVGFDYNLSEYLWEKGFSNGGGSSDGNFFKIKADFTDGYALHLSRDSRGNSSPKVMTNIIDVDSIIFSKFNTTTLELEYETKIQNNGIFVNTPYITISVAEAGDGISIAYTGTGTVIKVQPDNIKGTSTTIVTDPYHFTTKKYVDDTIANSLVTDNIKVSGTALKAEEILTKKLTTIDTNILNMQTTETNNWIATRRLTQINTTAKTLAGQALLRPIDISNIVTTADFDSTSYSKVGTTNSVLQEGSIIAGYQRQLAIALTIGHTAQMSSKKIEVSVVLKRADGSVVRYGNSLIFYDTQTRGQTSSILSVVLNPNDSFITGGYYLELQNINPSADILTYSTIDITVNVNQYKKKS